MDKLVIGEFDKLGRNDQLLCDVEDAIAKSKESVHKQQALVAALERDGRDTRAAVALLNGLCESVLVYENYRGGNLSPCGIPDHEGRSSQ